MKNSKTVFLLLLIFFSLTGCGCMNKYLPTLQKIFTEGDEIDIKTHTENLKEIDSSKTAGNVTITIDRIENYESGVRVFWTAFYPFEKTEYEKYPGTTGFDPRPIIEIRGIPDSGMRLYDFYGDEFLPSEGWVQEPTQEGESQGITFFPGIDIKEVKKISVTNVIIDLPVEAVFEVTLPIGGRGEVVPGEEKEIEKCFVKLEKVIFTDNNTKASFSTVPTGDETFSFITLSGVTLEGRRFYDFQKVQQDEFIFNPVDNEAKIRLSVKKAQYLVSGFWEWEL